MKILHVSHGYPPADSGGVEAYLRMVVEAQRIAGDEIVIAAGSIELRDTCRIETHEFEQVRVLRLFRDDWFNDHYAHSYHPGLSRLLATVFRQEQPDLVHVHQWIRLTSDIVARAHAAGLPTIVTLHDVYTSCPRAFRVDRDGRPCSRELSAENCATCVPRFGHESASEITAGIELFGDQYRSELQAADRVLVATDATADLLHRTTGTDRGRFTVHDLPYQPRFQGLTRPVRPAGDDKIRFGYWGSLSPHKGPHILLAAFRSLLTRVDVPVELHLLGPLATDAERTRLETLARHLPVTFHGPFTATELAAAGLDVAVFPVICFEGFGLGLAEAFELGLPAIVSDIGALAGRIGNAGLTVPPGDVEALTEAMTRLASDPDLRAQFATELPTPPPDPVAHTTELRQHYEAILGAERRICKPIDSERRAQLLVTQREAAHAALRDARGRRDPQ